MREIKFKAIFQHEETGRFIEKIYGIWNKESEIEAICPYRYNIVANDLQYTGLKDKHGKEIYEGDIISAKMHGVVMVNSQPSRGFVFERMKVEFVTSQGLGRFVVTDKNGEPWSGLGSTEIEVIGNIIYSNPELMEGL